MLFHHAMEKNNTMVMAQRIRARTDCIPSSFMRHLGKPEVDFFFGNKLPSMLQPILFKTGYNQDFEGFVKAVGELVLIDILLVNVDRNLANFFIGSDYVPFALDQGHALREYRSTREMLLNSAVMECVQIIWGESARKAVFKGVLEYFRLKLQGMRQEIESCLSRSLASDPLFLWLHAVDMPMETHPDISAYLPRKQAQFFSEVFSGETRRFIACGGKGGCKPQLHVMMVEFILERLGNLSTSAHAVTKGVQLP